MRLLERLDDAGGNAATVREDPLAVDEGCFVQRYRPSQITGRPVGVRQVVPGDECVQVVGAEDPLPVGDCHFVQTTKTYSM